MKTFNKSILLFALVLITIAVSCKKGNEVPNGGEPAINYIRVTNPNSADSLLVGASQGSLIAIIGVNLEGAVKMVFNDQPATLNPSFITSTSILVSVPAPIPTKIDNMLHITFSNGKTLDYPFTVQISKPLLSNMLSEFVNSGSIAIIRGNYFYAPLTVTFTGGQTGELVNVAEKEIQVRVPAGVQAGQITVKTNFGETKSDFWFRDNRNIFLSSDPYEGWWNESYVVTAPGASDPPAISGNYIRVKKPVGAWSWSEIAGGPATAMPLQSKKVPDAAILKPSDYNLKFEVNTVKPYTSNQVKINVALLAEESDGYVWKPPFDTKGQWQTVVIPFEEVVASYKVKPTLNAGGYWTRLWFHGPGDLDADISFDNFRIVPKVSK